MNLGAWHFLKLCNGNFQRCDNFVFSPWLQKVEGCPSEGHCSVLNVLMGVKLVQYVSHCLGLQVYKMTMTFIYLFSGKGWKKENACQLKQYELSTARLVHLPL